MIATATNALYTYQTLERVTGFEPVPSAWKAVMLAIEHHTRNLNLVGVVGVEPTLFTTWDRIYSPEQNTPYLQHTLKLVGFTCFSYATIGR